MTGAWLLRRQVVWAAVWLLAAIMAVDVVVWLAGLADGARDWLAFEFAHPPARPSDAFAVAGGNLRLAAAVLLAALLVQLRPSTRPALDLIAAALVALNAGLAGVALAAYGRRLLEAVAAHAALELAAFAIAGGTYLTARRGALEAPRLAAAAAGCTVLLGAAAAMETYIRIGAGP